MLLQLCHGARSPGYETERTFHSGARAFCMRAAAALLSQHTWRICPVPTQNLLFACPPGPSLSLQNQGCLPQEGQPHSESPHRLGAPCAHASSLSFCPIQAIALIGSLEEKRRQASSSCCPGGRCFHVFPNSPASNKFTSFFILCPISRSVLSPTFLFDHLTKKRLKFVKYNVELTFSIDHAWGRSSFYISSIRGFYGTTFNSP